MNSEEHLTISCLGYANKQTPLFFFEQIKEKF